MTDALARSEALARCTDALARCTRATLAFDLARVDANMAHIADAAHAHGIRVLFAAKSFPHARVLELAAHRLDGFDVASPGELASVPRGAIISIADPTGAAIAHAPAHAHAALAQATRARVIAVCETADHVRAAPPNAEIAIRISASLTGLDPAIGAVLDGTGHRRSRFGLDDRAQVAALAAAAAGRPIGLHVHHGPVTATSADRFIATARAALAFANSSEIKPTFLDLGGAWHGLADLPAAFAQIRAALPPAIDLLIEPGRSFSDGAGFACGIVQASRSLADRELRVVDLSRICHLRWSAIDLLARAPHPGTGRRVLVVGPTCFEEDTLGEWITDPAQLTDRVLVQNVSGYALAWNTGFAGVPPADPVLVE